VNDEERTMARNEIELHRKLKCRKVVRMCDAFEGGDDVYLVLEYVHSQLERHGGSLCHPWTEHTVMDPRLGTTGARTARGEAYDGVWSSE
jgi:hypothetical protein